MITFNLQIIIVQTDESSTYRHYLASTAERDGIFSICFFIGIDYFYLCTSNMRLSAYWYNYTKCLKAPVGNDFILFSIPFLFQWEPHLFQTYKEQWDEKQNKTKLYFSLLCFYGITNVLIHMPLFLFMLLMSFSSYIIFLVLHFRNSLLLLLNTWLQVICTLSVLQPSALGGKKYPFSHSLMSACVNVY